MSHRETNHRSEPTTGATGSTLTAPRQSAGSRLLYAARSEWTRAAGYQRFAYTIAAVLFASAIFHVGVFLASGTAWGGPISWRKPISFALSFGIAAATFAWILRYLPEHRRRNWLVLGTFTVAGGLEVGLITLQRWRGVASHFNRATPFDTTVFGLMGVLVVLVALSVLAFTLLAFVSLRAPPSMALAIRAGLVVFVGGLGVGEMLLTHGMSRTTDPTTGAFVPAGLTGASTFGTAGEMTLPHALAFHALQAFVVLAWLLTITGWTERRRIEAVGLAVVGYLGVVAVAFATAFAGRAPTDPTPFEAVVLVASLLLLIGVAGRVLLSLWRTRAKRSVVPAEGVGTTVEKGM